MDLASNALAYPYSQVFDEAPEESFVSGTVIDNATGRPLPGARVVVTATDGVALSEPLPEQTTAVDGRFLIPVPAGTHDLTVARPGYTPVFRIATTSTGVGTEIFAPRLTPASSPENVGTSGGTVTSEGATLDVPTGALAAAAAVALTPVDEQGLAALLPYGWSPRGAVWLDVEADLQIPAALSFPVESADGTLLTVAELDLVTLQWRSLGDVAVTDGQVTVSVSALGAYAALEADSGSVAPPAAISGEVLGSSPTPTGTLVASAAVGFDPEVVLPTQTSLATVIYTLTDEVASGLPLTVVIQEELTLLDNTVRREAPYRADLLLYRTSGGAARSRFRLRPSVVAQTTPIQLGAEDVEVQRYADESVRGNVLGPEGGTVLGDEGDRIDVPAGSLLEPTAIVITRRTVADLPLAVPTSGTVDGVVEVDLGGTVMLSPGRITLTMDTPPAAGEVGLLLQVVDVDGTPYYRAMAELEPSASGWTSKAIAPDDLPWPGLREGGQYVFVRFTAPRAFVRGTARRVDGAPLVGGIVSFDSVDWIQLTDAEGRYVLPVPVGTASIRITNRENGNTIAHEVITTAGGERANLDTQVEIVAPTVVSTTPADGAIVPAGLNPSVTFSESVDPATVADGIRLLSAGGQAIALTFDVQGVLVHVLPAANLVPGASYQLRVSFGVKDFQGYGLAVPVTVSFSTQDIVLPSEIDASKIFLYEPDAGGNARVVGDPGAVPSDHLIWVENLTSYSSTVSTNSQVDSSFDISIGASIGDVLLFHVLVPGANEIFFRVGPFMGTDRKSAWVGAEAVSFTTADDITVTVEEETFDADTRVSVASRDLAAAPPSPVPDVVTQAYAFDLDLGGAQPRRPLQLRVPAPAGAQPDWYLVAKSMEALGDPVWSLKDIMVLDNGYLTTDRAVPAKGLQGARTVPSGGSTGGDTALPGKAGELDPRDYKIGLVTAGSFSIFSGNNPMAWLIAPVVAFGAIFSDQIPGLLVEAADALDYVAGWHQLAVPTLLNQPFTLRGLDMRSGYEVFTQAMAAPTAEVVLLDPSTWLDNAPPYPVAGGPVRFYFVLATPGERDIAEGVRVSVTENRDAAGELLDDQTLTVTFAKGSVELDPNDLTNAVEVRMLALDSGLMTSHTIGASIESSDVVLSRSVKVNQPVLVTVAAVAHSEDWIEIAWSEALPEDTPGIELYLIDPEDPTSPGKRIEQLLIEPVETYETIRLRPEAGWRSGEQYRLRLKDTLIDVAENGWLDPIDPTTCSGGTCVTTHFDVLFEIASNKAFDSFDFQVVRDIARLGNLLFVAAGQQGLWVLDASDPNNVKNYLARQEGATPINENLSYPFAFNDDVRGVDVDPHGRVIVVGGGLTGFGQLKVLDPLRIDAASYPAGDPDNLRMDAFRGSTLLSDPLTGDGGIYQLPPGKPIGLDLRSWDLVDDWVVGEEVPEEITSQFTVTEVERTAEPGVYDVTVEGTNAVQGLPVTLRNRTRQSWQRTDARDTDGYFRFEIEAREGEELKLVRHLDLVAYVVVEGVGIAAVDVNHFYDELEDGDGDGVPDFDRSNIQSQVLRYYDELDKDELPLTGPLCSTAPVIPFDPTRVIVVPDISPSQDEPLTLLTAVGSYGLVILRAADANQPVDLEFVTGVCGTGAGPAVSRMSDMALVQIYPVQLRADDGSLTETLRDYAVLTTLHGWVLVVDITDRENLFVAAKIELPGTARGVTVNRELRQLYVSAGTDGVRVVELNGPFPDHGIDLSQPTLVDEDQDGEDDRLIETVEFKDEQGDAINVLRRAELWNDLGLAWIGGLQDLGSPGQRALGGFAFGVPPIHIVDAENLGFDGRYKILQKIAPFGVPTDDFLDLPGVIRVQATLPSYTADANGEVRLELVGLGPGGLEIRAAGDPEQIADLPPTHLREEQGLLLKRLADNPWETGYNNFVSDPVVVLADLRASVHYKMTTLEKQETLENVKDKLCTRCDLVAEGLYEVDEQGNVNPEDVYPEILSGHRIGVRLPSAVRDNLKAIYNPLMLQEMEVTVDGVPWDVSRTLYQEPTLSPAFDSRGVQPGLLLHSGELVLEEEDVALTSRVFNIALQRTYRSQTLGDGPFGPGWDHSYHMRLRELPNGDVELFSRGRRERFAQKMNGEFRPPPGRFVTLERNATGWMIVDPHANLMTFDRFGRLVRISDPVKKSASTGNQVDLTYDQKSRLATVSSEGRYLVFDHDAKDHVRSVTDQSGREWTYEYDGDGRLTDVVAPPITLGVATFPDRRTTYTYEALPAPSSKLAKLLYSRANLDSITDPRAVRWVDDIEYADVNNDGVADEVQAQYLDSLPVSYVYSSGQAIVQDRNSKTWTYQLDVAGHVTSIEDPILRYTTREYDEHGSLLEDVLVGWLESSFALSMEEASQRSAGNVEFETQQANGAELNGSSAELVTQTTYHTRTNLPIQVKYPGGDSIMYGRNEAGLLTFQRHDPVDGSTAYMMTYDEYNDHGQLVQTTNPNGHITRYEYFETGPEKGFLKKAVVEPGGLALTTEYETDDRGNVTAIVDPRGVRHELDYNEADWLIERRMAVAGGADAFPVNYREVFVYDAVGNVVEHRRGYDDGSQMTATKTDIGNLGEIKSRSLETAPGQWVTETYFYDNNLNRTSLTRHDGTTVVNFEYSDANQLTSVETATAGIPSTVGYTYVPDGQIDTVTDPNGHVYQTMYDAFSRPYKIINPLGMQTITYDDRHNPRNVRYFDAAGNIASRQETLYDGFGRPWQSKTWIWDNQSGTYTGVTPPQDAVIAVTETTYDAVSNVRTIKDPNGNLLTFEFDAAERLHKVSDDEGNVKTLWRDAGGNISLEVAAEAGPGGSTTVTSLYVYDGLGRLTRETVGDLVTNTYEYDVRGNLKKATDGDNRFTGYSYDSLDRVTRRERSGGVSTSYGYDLNGYLQTVTDANNNTTSMFYDELDRMYRRVYSDAKEETYSFDLNGNAVGVYLPNGTALTQGFDELNRLKTVLVSGAAVGPTAASYSYDGLGSLTQEVAGGVTTSLGYDSAGRLLRETVGSGGVSHTVDYTYDAADNLVQTTYPSGRVVDFKHDKLNRVKSVEWEMGAELSPVVKASYGYRGEGLISQRTVGLDLSGVMAYDAARRPQNVLYSSGGETVFQESLTWTAGSMKNQSIRGDLGGKGIDLDYDSAYRLTDAMRITIDDTGSSQATSCGVLPDLFSFTYDQADNLLSRHSQEICESSTVDLPLDGTGRNRPGSISGSALNWDANGNLAQKGDLKFLYDYRDRLTEVRTAVGDVLVASYTYDALNRRIEKNVEGLVTRTVWSGQQPIEDYVGGFLKNRRTYGPGIDEIVAMETDLSGAGGIDNEYVPFYDDTGNLVLLTDIFGEAIERYEYSPFGERWIFVDSTAPAVEQVRVKNDALVVELSEVLLESALQQAIVDGSLQLYNVTDNRVVDMALTRPVLTGRQARRRLVISGVDPPESETSTWPQADDVVQLEIPMAALKDAFGNVATSDYFKSFTWPAIGGVIEDLAAPRLDRVCVTTDGRLEIELTEEVSTVSAGTEIRIDGAGVVWVGDPDGYVLRSQDPLTAGSHQVTIGTGALDLSGKGLSTGYSETFGVTAGLEMVVYSAPFPGLVVTSTTGNDFGFHGLRHDAETGLIYVRHRYYDPQMGRFISTDPYGYADSPSLYQFSLNNPANFRDPTGQYVLDTAFDVASLGIGIVSFNHNVSEGNVGAAALDAVGIVVDSLAILAPVPGGAGVALRVARSGKGLRRVAIGFSRGYKTARTSTRRASQSVKVARAAQLVDQAMNVVQGAYMAYHEDQSGWAAFNVGMAGLGVLGIKGRMSLCRSNCFAEGTPVLTQAGREGLRIRTGIRAGSLSGGGGDIAVPGEGAVATGLANEINWKGFKKGKLADHFDKHGPEFGDINQNEYLKQAKAFAAETGIFQESRVGNFIIRVDDATRRVFVGHSDSREIRTFYRASAETVDPFAEATDLARNLSGL